MIFYPAIDLKDGRCVRLVRGDMETATVFNDDPGEQARTFAAAGCQWIHVVDLDGAFAGRPVNTEAVEAILAIPDMNVQLGGGIRSMDMVDAWIARGVHRVILGTAAVNDPKFVKEACRAHPGRVAIGIDAKDGWVAVEGWADSTEVTALQLALRFQEDRPAAIIYTDISRDGTLEGPNLEATLTLARAVSTPVILSGGIAAMADVSAAKREGAGVLNGVICGRAIYEGRVDPTAAVALLAAEID